MTNLPKADHPSFSSKMFLADGGCQYSKDELPEILVNKHFFLSSTVALCNQAKPENLSKASDKGKSGGQFFLSLPFDGLVKDQS